MRKTNYILAFFLLWAIALIAPARADEIAQAGIIAKEDIQTTSARLATLRDEISKERIALASKLELLQAEVAQLRLRKEEASRMTWIHAGGYAKIKSQAASMAADIDSCLNLTTQYRREITGRMSAAHTRKYKTELDRIDTLLSSDQPEANSTAAQQLFELSQKASLARIGLDIFKGECTNRSGTLYDGVFITAGPCAWFCSIEKGFGGIIDLINGNLYPVIAERIHYLQLKRLIGGGKEDIKIDFTGGQATRIADAYSSFVKHIKSGGIIVIPILALGIIGLIGTIFKVGALSRLKIANDALLQEIITLVNNGKAAKAFKKAQSLGDPMGPVITEGINVHDAAREHLEEIMHEKILLQIPTLERFLPFLSVAASSAPLLGLLGTVTGMIRTFNLLTLFGSGKTNILAEGISEALITTEFGLIVAIPALLCHAFLARKVKAIIRTMEQSSLAFINGIKIKEGKNGNIQDEADKDNN